MSLLSGISPLGLDTPLPPWSPYLFYALPNSAVEQLAGDLDYNQLMGLQHVSLAKDLKKSDGTRYLKEKGWRGVDIHDVLRHMNVADSKLKILKLLRRSDWLNLMGLMDKEELLPGLKFFGKGGLLRLIGYLPKQLLIKMLMSVMSLKELVEKMPLMEIMTVLRSDRLPVKELVERLMILEPKYLRFLMEKITGQAVGNLSEAEMRPMLQRFKKHRLLDGIRYLPYKALQPLMMESFKQDPQLLMAMSDHFLFRQFEQMDRQQLMLSCAVLDKEILLQFFSQLPDSLLVQVAALANDSLFSKYMLSAQPNVLMWLGEQAQAMAG